MECFTVDERPARLCVCSSARCGSSRFLFSSELFTTTTLRHLRYFRSAFFYQQSSSVLPAQSGDSRAGGEAFYSHWAQLLIGRHSQILPDESAGRNEI